MAHEFSPSTVGNLRNTACQWIAENEVVLSNITLAVAEEQVYDMDEANIVVYLDLSYPGGCESFIQDFSE